MKGKEHCFYFVGENAVGYKNLNKPLITQVKTHEWLSAALLLRMSGAAIRCCPAIHFNLRAARDKPPVEKTQLLPLPVNLQGCIISCCQQRGNRGLRCWKR
jgi:hypothetical protein